MSKFITPGTVTIDTIKKAQQVDTFVKMLKISKLKTFKQIDGVLFKVSPQRGETQLVLPTNLLDSLIVSKHFSVLGLHHSKTRIRREITQKYFVDMRALKKTYKLNVRRCAMSISLVNTKTAYLETV
jgi:hypothetical protein